MSRRGVFITFEGGEGVGKSTQIKTADAWLAERGHDVVVTREPGGTARAERIRELVVSADGGPLSPLAELLLMFAARISHIEELILPALADGKVVLCDRFVDASYAYQGAGRGLPEARISELESWLPAAARPDLTILLDAPVETGLARARGRGRPDRFELEQKAFFERVRAAYLERAHRFPERFAIVDATASPKRVGAAICAVLESRLAGAAKQAE